ncbi:fatty acyl-CoA reductase 1-like isoform X2 [Frankliniella occidentalis]|uniref:Fatty acyl-CoA reductase n=1 Tax=Frankliniella occidentalis TaxID=133901 RepID=A0A6J1SZ17_FRAOC|nr:fatty acyl-CoA reductase 1-like isoform X2 [Frankliniella occidentalis]
MFQSEVVVPVIGGALAAAFRRVREEVAEKREQLVKQRAEQPTVAEFYKGRGVFITGGSGFLGRLLVEMLLRTCPDIGNVYLLLRPKKGESPQGRLQGLLNVPLFDRLRAEQPHALDKIVVLPGDITELGLGLSQEHRALLQREVSVVYHVAASVRFDDPFRKAVFTNLRSTREVVELARGMPQLKVLVHVSTAYTNINRDLIEERVYEPHLDWRQVIRMAEQTDPASLWAMDCLGPKLRDFHPNSYTFTKALAEKLIDDVASELPVVLVRPSIVTPTFRDPFPGWVDNLYGLGGVWAAGWKGLIRVTPGDGIVFDTVPADVVTKTTILASWARGRGISIRPLPDGAAPKGVEVVNATVGNEIGCSHRDMTWGLTEAGLANDLVFPGMIRDPKYQVVSNPIAYELLKFYHHILYGLVLDTAARITGRKPRAMKMYRIIEGAMEASLPFQLRQFKFELVNQRLLQILMHPADEDAYCIMEFFSVRDNLEKFKQWAVDSIRGVLVYALKEEDNPDKYRPQLERLRMLTKVYHGTMAAIAGIVVYCIIPS